MRQYWGKSVVEWRHGKSYFSLPLSVLWGDESKMDGSMRPVQGVEYDGGGSKN